METVSCKNCGNEFNGNYCPECGQKSKTSKIDLKYLQEETKYTLLHLNNGFLYTTKELFTRPGHATREFIEGKRVKHYKPLLFLFVLAGLYGFLLNTINIDALLIVKPEGEGAEASLEAMRYIAKNYSLFELLFLPIAALSSWLAFRVWQYNYIEHLIINAYAAGLRIAIQIILFPLSLVTAGTVFSTIVSGIFTTFSLLTTAWLFIQFFSDKPLDKVILRILLLIFHMVVFTIIVFIPVGIVYAILKST